MRAETQNTVEAIRKSLALLGQRLGLETADYRLEEFNARVEDPNLWDDPARRSLKSDLIADLYDHLPEAAFYMVGDIEEVKAKAQRLAAEAA